MMTRIGRKYTAMEMTASPFSPCCSCAEQARVMRLMRDAAEKKEKQDRYNEGNHFADVGKMVRGEIGRRYTAKKEGSGNGESVHWMRR